MAQNWDQWLAVFAVGIKGLLNDAVPALGFTYRPVRCEDRYE